MENKDIKLCKDCDFLGDLEVLDDTFKDQCFNPDATYSDFLYGLKSPYNINRYGDCLFFKAKED